MKYNIKRNPIRKGVANTNNEKVFIAASLYDPNGDLVSDDWGHAVLRLVTILGPENVQLSLYENDADQRSKGKLWEFQARLACNHSIVEGTMNYEALPHITMPDGTQRLKRMAFLAEVRNRALAPLRTTETRFDKLLYLNDVIFSPADAANLLFSTNQDDSGRAQYRAACAVDFDNPFKFYDTFATRDSEGFDMRAIFYPWFTSAGEAISRSDVLAQKDAVRVKSCWGGMVAFDAQWFQYSHIDGADTSAVQLPLQFRAEEDSYWDSSECCLVHADLAALTSSLDNHHGIFMNPYVRVAYTKKVLDWLWLSQRVERLYAPTQAVVK
ncbi:Putative mannosyltransferase 1, CMT1 [Septoria linicola]|uniref:Mannosyltransferase 1, CMT1 n=1 Tax=Septoria linicola TaxID=215465 RepID=A0A9Q9AWU3_9PEZI|nr:Putative mannosyltransferase 1, CMT1 [Septoria linicola]